ncbi:thionin-like protein 2 [Mercurialis annua]|uniref:thionin-like protein 2 n=1 Tax=Mercurialis annua TaxID=3986 RepID=UPI0021604E47|nr:thionin-like protein 2 [Mercurialis annua]
MERKNLSVVLMIVVIGMLAGQSNAWFKDFKNCMKTCLIDCAIPPWEHTCPTKCLAKCIIHPLEKYTQSPHQFCTFGCATSKCSNLISKDDSHLDEVEGCVDECSQTCVINYNPEN